MSDVRCPNCGSWNTDELDNSGWCVCLSCEHEWQMVDDLEDDAGTQPASDTGAQDDE